jgi:hypothetical protein
MRSKHGLTATVVLSLVAWATAGSVPQAAVGKMTPFDIIGFIDAATVTNSVDLLSGGTITVNGTTIIVPRNTILQMPAAAMTWSEVFTKAPAPYGPTQSGLARTDTPAPATTYEVHIQGNRVIANGQDQYIAGLMFVAQQALNTGAGFINYIDYSTGEMRVGGQIGSSTTGARVRLNDPLGRYGLPLTPTDPLYPFDERFRIDEDNPTVRAETGYPMCVPRSTPATLDPLCPETNRPIDPATGKPLTVFTMAMPNFDGPTTGPLNPYLAAPFEVGDYVTYSGNLLNDKLGKPFIAAWSVIANDGIFTVTGTQPVYVGIDVMLLGVGGIPDPNLPQEDVVRTRVEGFTTDPHSGLEIYAVDVDACSGAESWRYYGSLIADSGPPIGRVKGRWRWRPSLDAPWLPPTRELIVVNDNGVVWEPTPNGLYAGQYQAPNFEFIFPENLNPGNPPVPGNYQDFPFLVHGSGPYDGSGPRVGQLSPWPGDPVPTAAVCTDAGAVFAPVADAGVNQFVTPGSMVMLNALASHDTNSPLLPLTYTWQQVPNGSPIVALQAISVDGGLKSFIAPPLDPVTKAPVTLQFKVTASNGTLTSSATVDVKDAAVPVSVDSLTAIATFRLRRSRLTVTATTTDPNAVLTLQGFGPMGPGIGVAITVPAPATARAIIIVGVNPAPDTVTIVSSSGGVITVPVTFLLR